MTAAISKLIARLADWRSWELNPVVVKELRQAVRSWAVTGMLMLFLVVLFCTALGFLINESVDVSVNQQVGASVFQAFMVILTGASVIFIPLYVGVRLATERQETNLDLLYITTLTPQRIVRGKFLCGAYLALLFFSACMPFMVFTNLLRGIDLPTIFFILLCLFLVVCAAIQVAIFLACLPVSKVFKILIALFAMMWAFTMMFGLVVGFLRMMGFGIGSMLIGGGNFWTGFFTSFGLMTAAGLLLHFLSVAMISPIAANRALPLRIYLTLLWFFGGVLSLFWMWKEKNVHYMIPWVVISFAILTAAAIVNVSNADRLSFRVRRRIPVSRGGRAVAFLFFNGAAGGLTWVAMLTAGTFGVLWLCMQHGLFISGISRMSPSNVFDFESQCGAFMLYVFAYGLTALFIHRRFLGRRSPRLAGILTVLLAGAWALVPVIAMFFMNRLSMRSLGSLQLGNIFNVFSVNDDRDKVLHLIFAGGWLLLALLINARWYFTQVRNFRRLQQADEPPVIEEVAASQVAHMAVEMESK